MTGVAGRRFGGTVPVGAACSGRWCFCRTPADVFDDASARTSGRNGKYCRGQGGHPYRGGRAACAGKQVQHLDQRMSIIERRAQIHVLGHEFAESLVGELLALPDPADFRHSQDVRALLLQRTSGAQLRVEREIDDLAEGPAAIMEPVIRWQECRSCRGIQRYHDFAGTLPPAGPADRYPSRE